MAEETEEDIPLKDEELFVEIDPSLFEEDEEYPIVTTTYSKEVENKTKLSFIEKQIKRKKTQIKTQTECEYEFGVPIKPKNTYSQAVDFKCKADNKGNLVIDFNQKLRPSRKFKNKRRNLGFGNTLSRVIYVKYNKADQDDDEKQ